MNMLKNNAISHYNRLEGVAKIVSELRSDKEATAEYKEDLDFVLGKLIHAQDKLPWSPDKAR